MTIAALRRPRNLRGAQACSSTGRTTAPTAPPARPVSPWTSLGYTFDWALGPTDGTGQATFVRFGESEYVVPQDTPVTIVGAESSADYCSLK